MRKLLNISCFIPLVHLLLCLVSVLTYKTEGWKDFNLYIIHQTTGAGLFIWVTYFILCTYLKRCLYLKVACIGLMTLNILNILHYFFNIQYILLYQSFIVVSFCILSVILLIKERNGTLQR